MKILPLINIFIFTLLLLTAKAQDPIYKAKTVHVKGSSLVLVENNITREQAKQKAVELAMINAIENAFGTFVGQTGNTVVADGKITYNINGITQVKGEWIRTSDGPKFKDEIRNISGSKETETWISCTIEGDAREIRSLANLDVKTLKCPQIKCETVDFLSSEMLCLYFKSPVDGFLSVYNEEENGITRQLFPYLSHGSQSNVRVKGDEDYILFSTEKHLNKFNVVVDPIELVTDRSTEFNTLYVVFSPDDYDKESLSDSVLQADKTILPKSLPTKKFQKWLSDLQATNSKFQVKRIKISISKD
ncbi:MAG: hypothetical protein ACOYN4_01815 [Bacteroidales bacterium]